MNRIWPHKDDPSPQKANSTYNLGSDSGRIEHDPVRLQHVGERILADQHEQCRTHTYEDVRSQPSTLEAQFALEPDDGGRQEREPELGHLTPAVAIRRDGSEQPDEPAKAK